MAGQIKQIVYGIVGLIACSMPLSAVRAQDLAAPLPGAQRDPLWVYRATGIDFQQEAKLRGVARDFELAMMTKTRLLMALMRDMSTLSVQADPNPKAVLAKQAEINRAHADLAVTRLKFNFKMRKVLNHEQRQRLIQVMHKAHALAPGLEPRPVVPSGN